MSDSQALRITEIFYSLQGEADTVGWPTVFIRLTGCPLRCNYCDTDYAFSGGQQMRIPEILEEVSKYNPKYITVTGGEPLAQKEPCLELLKQLAKQNYHVSIETSGALDISQIDPRVIKTMDLKTPSSQESDKNLLENLKYLAQKDQIKFVIANQSDYIWAKEMIEKYHLINLTQILFSPSHGVLENQILADWILEDSLQVRFQLQLHKYIWGEQRGK